MYGKDLQERFILRLSSKDMDFLRELSAQRGVSVAECLRSMIGEYRRSLDTLKVLSSLEKEGQLSHGNPKTDIND